MIQLKATSLKENMLLFLLVLFYFSEALNKFTLFSYGDTIFFAKTIKGCVFLYCGLCVFSSKKNIQQIFLIVALVILFIIGQLNIDSSFNLRVVINFIKYLFPLVLFIYFNQYKLDKVRATQVIYVFEKVVFINSIAIISGFLFDISLFQTYGNSRFGYSGLLISSATSTYFYSIILFHYFIKYKEKVFYNPQRVIVLFSVILVGTKSLLLVFLFTLALYTYFYISMVWKKAVFFILFIIFCFLSYYFIYKHDVFNKIIIEEGFFASLTSLRSLILIEEMLPFIRHNWTLPNYLFGGINNLSTRPQMALFDLIYFLGFTGCIIYLFTYIKNYFCFKVYRIHILFFGILFLTSFISGNFFLNASVVIYLIILRESVRSY